MSERTSFQLTAIAVVAIALASCGSPAEPRLSPISADALTAELLWRRISEESPFGNWKAWPDHEGIQAGQAPHGPLHRIYVNNAISEALPLASRAVPDGGIVVKLSLNADSKPLAITVMAKADGFDEANGDWFWARFDMEGKALASGSVRGCIVCHAGMKDNDYVIVHRLDAPISD